MPINRLLHFIWLGSLPKSDTIFVMKAWKALNPSVTVFCWYDSATYNPEQLEAIKKLQVDGVEFKDVRKTDELTSMRESKAYTCYLDPSAGLSDAQKTGPLKNIIGTFKPNYSAASDILRIHLLHHFGGIYSDIDIVPQAEIPNSALESDRLHFRRITVEKKEKLNPDLQAWDNSTEQAKLLFEKLDRGVNVVFDDLPLIKRIYILSPLLGDRFGSGMNITGPSFFTQHVCKILNVQQAQDISRANIFPVQTYVDGLFLHSWVDQIRLSPRIAESLIDVFKGVLSEVYEKYSPQEKDHEIRHLTKDGVKTHENYFTHYIELRNNYQTPESNQFWNQQDAVLIEAFEKTVVENKAMSHKRPKLDADDANKDTEYSLGNVTEFDCNTATTEIMDYLKSRTDISNHTLLILRALINIFNSNHVDYIKKDFSKICSEYAQELIEKHRQAPNQETPGSMLLLLLLYILRFNEDKIIQSESNSEDFDRTHPCIFVAEEDKVITTEKNEAKTLIHTIIENNTLNNDPFLCMILLGQVSKMFFYDGDIEGLYDTVASCEAPEDLAEELGAYWKDVFDSRLFLEAPYNAIEDEQEAEKMFIHDKVKESLGFAELYLTVNSSIASDADNVTEPASKKIKRT